MQVMQQEILSLRAQVQAQAGMGEAVTAIRELAAAHGRKEQPSLIDAKGLGKPKEFSGKEEDFQQWSQKTESFCTGVIPMAEFMLEWAADQATEIVGASIEVEFGDAAEEGREVPNLDFVLAQMHTALMALTHGEANDIVANAKKNPLEAWRRLQKRFDSTTGGRKRNLLRTIISPGRCGIAELQAGIERWES